MAWDHLSINRPHLVYIILGGFTSLFMLCSSFIKERLYIGEATVATLCGIIFGPHAANLIDPSTWGNTDQITLEFSRIVLVVQCFAVGVELPKYYMEKHWRSVVCLLLPVMTFGWLITSLFIWWMIPSLDWLESLCCAACVTATDPVLASSVVGKGKFAKRVPKHLRDLLSAESGCNDGMAFPFIYLALYIIDYRYQPNEVALHWICITILYECVFGAIYGFIIGYIGRRGIRYAEERDLVDRESFLVFYFVLALFCAGSGSILGVDDLLVGFAAGVGFSNDGWFTQKTEESHVSNVIDLLINLAYFVYFGTIIPWDQYNNAALGITPWRLVVIAIFVLLFRRIPIMMVLKPIIPDIHTWREALFAGHFGPIGVGAIFVAILARADLETGGTTPLAELPDANDPNYLTIALIWPITTFLVICSIIVHGSSIAVFTLGKHINTLTLTMSFTTANEDGPSWMNRLPRIASQSKSMSKMSDADNDYEKDVPPGSLPPVGMPGNFLRRQKEEENPSRQHSRSNSRISLRRKKNKPWDEHGPGGPISQSAIAPVRRTQSSKTSDSITLAGSGGSESPDKSSPADEEAPGDDDDERNEGELGDVQDDPEMHEIMHHNDREKSSDKHRSDAERHPHHTNSYEEGDKIITENDDGDVIDVRDKDAPEDKARERRAEDKALEDDKDIERSHAHRGLRKKLGVWRHKDDDITEEKAGKNKSSDKRGAALAYQFGNTIIVEDEDGEVVKKYELPPQKRKGQASGEGSSGEQQPNEGSPAAAPIRQGIHRMGTWTGFSSKAEKGDAKRNKKPQGNGDDDDTRIRFTIGGAGRRLTKDDFLKEMQSLDPSARAKVLEESDAPPAMKDLARKDASAENSGSHRLFGARKAQVAGSGQTAKMVGARMAKNRGADVDGDSMLEEGSVKSRRNGSGSDDDEGVGDRSGGKSRDISDDRQLGKKTSPSQREPETAAERRRREQVLEGVEDEAGPAAIKPTQRTSNQSRRETPADRRRREAAGGAAVVPSFNRNMSSGATTDGDDGEDSEDERFIGETPAEKRRRQAALKGGDDDDSDDDNTERVPPPTSRSRGIRFAEEPVRGRT